MKENDTVTGSISRRTFGRLVLGMTGTLMMPHVARAAGGSLSVAISAVYQKAFESYAIPKMKEMHGIDVTASTFLSAEVLARAIAQKSSPQISLMTLDQGPWQQGKDMGLWSTLDSKQIPSLESLPSNYVDSDLSGTALFNMMTGLCYDSEAITAAGVSAPSSFFDMWKEGYRDRVALPQFSNTFAFITLAETVNLLGKDPAESFDAGFAKIAEMKPNIRTFIGPLGQLVQLYQQKEIWLSYAPHFTAMQSAKAGLPIKWAEPSEGAVASSHYMAIPKNAPNPEGSALLADMMLAPEFQKYLAQQAFMGPVNPKTELDPEFKESFPITAEVTERAHAVPWRLYNAQRVELAKRWLREIQS